MFNLKSQERMGCAMMIVSFIYSTTILERDKKKTNIPWDIKKSVVMVFRKASTSMMRVNHGCIYGRVDVDVLFCFPLHGSH